jgi:pterin-4a-carbinolamine dehydratase
MEARASQFEELNEAYAADLTGHPVRRILVRTPVPAGATPCPTPLPWQASPAHPAEAEFRPSPERRSKRISQTPDWILLDDASRIERRFTFKNFVEAFAFVQQASDLAEREGHHPDICFGWGYATVSLFRQAPHS